MTKNYNVEIFIKQGKKRTKRASTSATSPRVAIDKSMKTLCTHTTPLEGKRRDDQLRPGDELIVRVRPKGIAK